MTVSDFDIALHEEEHLFTSSPVEDIPKKDSLLHEESMNMWEMANLYPSETGLNQMVVWVGGGGDKLQHGPRVKVVRGMKYKPKLSSTVPLTGKPRIIGNADLSQDEFADLMEWIRLNREVILKYWHDEISTKEMVDSLKKIGSLGP